MKTDLNKIEGYSFFDTPTEKERIRNLLQLVEELTSEEIKFIVPNMTKDAEGKVENIGFFAFLESTVYEFRNFLNRIDFDYTKWDVIHNIRLEANKYKFDEISGEIPSLTLDFYHGTSSHDFHTAFTVFGQEKCDYVYGVAKKLNNFLISS